MPFDAVREDERGARRSRRAGVRQPAQLGGRCAAPARSVDHRRRVRCASSATRSRCRPASALPFDTQWELLETLQRWGIPVAPHRKCCKSLAEVNEWARDVEARVRAELDFGIDGGVVKVDSLAAAGRAGRRRRPRAALGDRAKVRARHRRDAAARHPGERGTHRGAQSVRRARGGGDRRHDGAPRDAAQLRSRFAPRICASATSCCVKRAGDVIPQVIGPVPEKRDAKNPPQKIAHPDALPVVRHAGASATRKRWRSTARTSRAPARQLEAIVHFASRGAMDIRGLSYARIEQLIAASLVHDVADLYALTRRSSSSRSSGSPRRRRRTSSTRSPHRRRSRCRACCSGSASGTSARPRRSCSRGTSARWTRIAPRDGGGHPRAARHRRDRSPSRSSPTSRTRRPSRWWTSSQRAGLTMTEPMSRGGGRCLQGDDGRRHRHAADAVARAGDGADRVAGRTRDERGLEGDDVPRRRRGRGQQVGQGPRSSASRRSTRRSCCVEPAQRPT